MNDQAHEDAVSGQSWAEFCDMLKDAGDLVIDNSTDDLDRLEGFRYLTRLLRNGLEKLESQGPAFPRVGSIAYNVKIGCDNPDALYQSVAVSPEYVYRISGPRGTVNYLSLNVFSGGFAVGQGPPGRQGTLAFNDPQPDEQVDVIASVEEPEHLEPGQRWIEMGPESNQVAIRNFYLDRTTEEPSDLRIERLTGPDEVPPPLSSKKLNSGLVVAAMNVHGILQRFAGRVDVYRENPNTLDRQTGESAEAWGDPTQIFRHGYWTLESGQALVVDVPPIEAYYWNFQLNNIWEESLDFEWHQITVNKHTAAYEPDGTARIIVADEDPGFGNWIDTSHHRHGGMGLRYNQADEDIAPTCRVVDVSDLDHMRQ